MREIKWYGWKPDLPDQRDKILKAPTARRLPQRLDLRDHPNMPPIYNQGPLGSCVGNGIAAAEKFRRPEFPGQPSRLYLYYNARAKEGTVNEDSGAYIRDGMSTLRHLGACSESVWPYEILRFADKPPQLAYNEGRQHTETLYERVPQKAYSIRYCLAMSRLVVFGFSVYESFESLHTEKTGVVEMPGRLEDLLGGHAVCIVGAFEDEKLFLCRNSWDTDWGMLGYFTMPYDYVLDPDLSADFWSIH